MGGSSKEADRVGGSLEAEGRLWSAGADFPGPVAWSPRQAHLREAAPARAPYQNTALSYPLKCKHDSGVEVSIP